MKHDSFSEISEREVSVNIGEMIGSGPRATVYKGVWRGVEVAVKVPTKDMPFEKFIAQYAKA